MFKVAKRIARKVVRTAEDIVISIWARVKPKQPSLLANTCGTGLVEWLGIIILMFVVVGTMILNVSNTTVGRGQEVDAWISGL
jgi:hypothetical protein